MSNTILTEANREWATRPADQRFSTLSDLRASVAQRRDRSRDRDINIGDIKAEVVNENGIAFNSGISIAQPTHWAFGQIAGQIGAPARYLRDLPAPLAVECINHGIQTNQDTVKVLSIANDEGPRTLQAVTSPTYGRIWDADVVDATQRIVDRTGGKFFNPRAYKGGKFGASENEPAGLYASDRDVFIFLVDGGELIEVGSFDQRAQLQRGFFVWNSEVGNATFGIKTFLFNVVCNNHLVWGATDINELTIRHTKGGPARFDRDATPHLLNYINSSTEEVRNSIGKTQDFLLPSPEEIYSFVNRAAKFTKSEVAEACDFARREEGDCRTLWQIIQGFTASAREYSFADARIDLEERAGKLVNLAN